MAWLQNLAGKAEDLLNKVDQNAARVLNEPPGINTITNLAQSPEIHENGLLDNAATTTTIKIDVENIPEQSQTESILNEVTSEVDSANSFSQLVTANSFEKIKSMTDSIGLISAASSNSLNLELNENTLRLESQIAKLEMDNEELSKQILNMQHMHSELQHDYSNLQNQLDRVNETAIQAQHEMQEYRMRARRLLEEKESKLPSLQYNESTEVQAILQINQQLKEDLDNEIKKSVGHESKLNALTKELSVLQQQYLNNQKENQRIHDDLRQNILQEKRTREEIEEENRIITRQLQKLDGELKQAKLQENNYITEIEKLNQQLKHRPVSTPRDTESQLHVLTQTLMHKQNTLDTITSERNALKIQLEKLELQYSQLCSQRISRPVVNSVTSNDYDDSRIPRFLQVSPLDAGMTQRVKHAYSTLDTFSIRTGVFLRRYPLARIFLMCYMGLLHFWVLVILFTYVPGSR